MQIALIVPAIEEKGPIVFTKYLVSELEKITDYLEVFYFKDEVSFDLGVKCTKISFFHKYNFDRFDIVHTTMAISDIYARRYIDKRKWISSMHNYMDVDLKMLYSPIKARLLIFLWKHAVVRCSNIIVSSHPMEEYYKTFLGEKNYTVIPYGISEPEYSPIDSQDKKIIEDMKRRGLTILGSVGVMIKRKGFEQLLNLLEREPKYGLILIGDGPEADNLKKISIQKGLEDRVMLTGFRSCSYNYYPYFDVYSHVSYSEGFGIAMLEAFSKSLPVVCSRLDIYQEYFTDDDVCYFVPGKIDELDKAIKKCIKNKEYYRKKSNALYKNIFSNKVMAKRHLQLYQEVSGKNNAKSNSNNANI